MDSDYQKIVVFGFVRESAEEEEKCEVDEQLGAQRKAQTYQGIEEGVSLADSLTSLFTKLF